MLSKLALVVAIADISDTTDWPEAVPILQKLRDVTMSAIEKWPLRVADNELSHIHRNIMLFCNKIGWDNGRHNIQVPINFALSVIEPICENVTDVKRKQYIKEIASVLNNAYYLFAGDDNSYPDYEIDIQEGLEASALWDEIWR